MIEFEGKKWRVVQHGEVIKAGDLVDHVSDEGDAFIKCAGIVTGSVGVVHGSQNDFKARSTYWTPVEDSE